MFWKFYFICLGISVVLALLTTILFTDEYGDDIPVAYLIMALAICAIPGLGMAATVVGVIGIVGSIINQDIVPREFNKDDDD